METREPAEVFFRVRPELPLALAVRVAQVTVTDGDDADSSGGGSSMHRHAEDAGAKNKIKQLRKNKTVMSENTQASAPIHARRRPRLSQRERSAVRWVCTVPRTRLCRQGKQNPSVQTGKTKSLQKRSTRRQDNSPPTTRGTPTGEGGDFKRRRMNNLLVVFHKRRSNRQSLPALHARGRHEQKTACWGGAVV